MSNDSKSLTLRPTAIVPTDANGFADLAARFSKSALLPDSLRAKPDDVFVTLLAGHELGFTPMASLRAVHVVKGKPILAADAMVALVLGRGAAKYFRCVEESDTSVTYETLREGAPEPQKSTWTIKDAERAGLAGGDNWRKYPRAMLKARCKAVLARDVYPDVLAGCYEAGEADEIEARSAPTRLPVQQARRVPEARPEPQPDPTTGEVIDVEPGDEQHDTWTPFLRAIEPILKDDTQGWTPEDVTLSVVAALHACERPADCDDIMRPIVAALDAGNGDPRIAQLRDQLRDAYKARKTVLRGQAA